MNNRQKLYKRTKNKKYLKYYRRYFAAYKKCILQVKTGMAPEMELELEPELEEEELSETGLEFEEEFLP